MGCKVQEQSLEDLADMIGGIHSPPLEGFVFVIQAEFVILDPNLCIFI